MHRAGLVSIFPFIYHFGFVPYVLPAQWTLTVLYRRDTQASPQVRSEINLRRIGPKSQGLDEQSVYKTKAATSPI